MNKYRPSSKSNPCPICHRGEPGSEKEGPDCRVLECGNVILCHTYRDKSDDINGYRFVRTSDKGAGWGVWVWAEKNENGKVVGRKIRPKTEQRQYFEYPARDGNPLVRVVRQKGASIEFFQEYWIDGQWLSASNVDDRLKSKMRQAVPVYRYHEVKAAIDRGEPIFLCEGESCCDALWDIGIAATTTIGGSKAYRNWGTYKEDLEDADLILCPDRDKAGIDYIDEVAKDFPRHRIYKAFKTSPVWGFLPDAGGLDIADEITAGKTKEGILEAIERKASFTGDDEISIKAAQLRIAVEQYLTEPDPIKQALMRGKICAEYRIAKQDFLDQALLIEQAIVPEKKTQFTDEEFFNATTDSIQYRLNRYLPVGEQILVASQAGVGKTNLVTDAVYSALSGEPFLGEDVLGPCKVLFISSDESEGTTRRRLISRGVNAVSKGNLKVWTEFDITKLTNLEHELRTWKPDLVCIDSITTVCQNAGIQEKDPEFALNLYRLKNLWSRHGCSAIVIHHATKNPDAKGLSKVSGSARIPAAFWGVFLLERTDENNPENPHRWLQMVKGREVEEFKVKLHTRPRGEWLEHGAFKVIEDDDHKEMRSKRDVVLDYLKERGVPLEYEEIASSLPVAIPPSSLYRILDQLEDRRLVSKRKSKVNYKKWVYFASHTHTPIHINAGNENDNAESHTYQKVSSFSSHSKALIENGNENESKGVGESENSHSHKNEKSENDGIVLVERVSAGYSHYQVDIGGGVCPPIGSRVRVRDEGHRFDGQIGVVAKSAGTNGSTQIYVDGDLFSDWFVVSQVEVVEAPTMLDPPARDAKPKLPKRGASILPPANAKTPPADLDGVRVGDRVAVDYSRYSPQDQKELNADGIVDGLQGEVEAIEFYLNSWKARVRLNSPVAGHSHIKFPRNQIRRLES